MLLTIFISAVILIAVVLSVKQIRINLISSPVFKFFKKALPALSDTEQEAINAGDIWVEGDLFQGNPDWKSILDLPKNKLTKEEQSFIDNEVKALIAMIDDYDISKKKKELPSGVWQYLKDNKFFSFIIPKEYDGLEFSAYAISTIVGIISSRSVSVAVTVMVPNSLGPGELLNHYGTEEQKKHWLPRLAVGKEVPCFALTGPEAGSDAGSISDVGVLYKKTVKGVEKVFIKITWEKRYITLAPVASVLGLAFKLRDPDNILGKKVVDLGITCALIPTNHKGVKIGRRHDPLHLSFMNGTTTGSGVSVPAEWIIGGVEYAGKGWSMLMQCLSSGRGISLPAVATGIAHLCTKTTSAYVNVRNQFGLPIGKFEGVQESIARIIANTYQMEAVRRFTATAVDIKLKPAIVSAISKYHMTEISRTVLNDAMDIHGGKAIQLGNKNYLGIAYLGAPVTITVEGANILTRSLMIFGQGAFRCHPFVLKEIEAVHSEAADAVAKFDKLLMAHVRHVIVNLGRSFVSAVTASFFNKAPRSSAKKHYKDLTRFSSILAVLTDFSLLLLQGRLKRKEIFSARLGDLLSNLYLSTAALNFYKNSKSKEEEFVIEYLMQYRKYKMAESVQDILQNFPSKIIGFLLKLVVFPLGNHFKKPDDKLIQKVAVSCSSPDDFRHRITFLCPLYEDIACGITDVELAYLSKLKVQPVQNKLNQAYAKGLLNKKSPMQVQLQQALDEKLLTADEVEQLKSSLQLCRTAIDVDDFAKL